MRCERTLPEGYRQIAEIDLQKNKKQMLLVNGLAFIIALIMIVPVLFAVPITTLFNLQGQNGSPYMPLIKMLVMLVGLVVYLVLHELVHGICIRIIGKRKPTYGFTGLYAFAASEVYFGKAPYLLIALAPVVLWGIVLAIITPLVPTSWFWVVYFIQIQNVSGAAGDMYVTYRMLRMPKDILVLDSGVAMKVFANNIGS